jgi:hypothetical protein
MLNPRSSWVMLFIWRKAFAHIYGETQIIKLFQSDVAHTEDRQFLIRTAGDWHHTKYGHNAFGSHYLKIILLVFFSVA